MNSPPKVSVIIPTYNRAHYLSEAVQSVLSQTLSDLELIVVDDGSTDSTQALLREVDDPRLLALSQRNRGISAAMNAGLNIARGEYIARLDSDDTWLPHMLAEQAAALDAHPELGAVYARAQCMDAQGRRLPRTWGVRQQIAGDSFQSMLLEDFTCNITVVARRTCFDKAGRYDETLRTSEDWDMWLRVARTHRFGFVDRVLAVVRVHEGGISLPTASSGELLESRRRVLDKAFALPDAPANAAEVKELAYTNLHIRSGLQSLVARDLRSMRRHFLNAIRSSGSALRTTIRVVWLTLKQETVYRHSWLRRLAAPVGALRRR